MAFATATLVNLVENKELVLNFLESKGIISEIKSKCNLYMQNSDSDNKTVPLFFALRIEFEEVKKKLIELITNLPLHFLSILNEVIQSIANNYLRDCGCELFIQIQQIHSSFVVINLPQREYTFSIYKEYINTSLSTFSCIISSRKPIEKYILQSTWKCTLCFNSPLIIVQKQKTVHKAPKCQICYKDCTELILNRVSSNFCSARVFETNILKNRKNYPTVSSLEIRLFDDICQDLKIGQEYIVTGIYDVFNKFYNVFSISLV
ncbi:hypothetical protein PVAND_011055 [Polypedilum vanderplanki]|uniref:Uncharacterized protein n=1 Tax=Polypedilum vanderplanki TaxID=319348 RepID=A0A9J6CID6_POLVA|nr:hypothetical protein PVAND_011055 [Polypedilum vanderplanki]